MKSYLLPLALVLVSSAANGQASTATSDLERPFGTTNNYLACIDPSAYINWGTPIIKANCVKDERDTEHDRQQGRAWDRITRGGTVMLASLMNEVGRTIGIGQGHTGLLQHLTSQSAGFSATKVASDTALVVTGAQVADASDGEVARRALILDPLGDLTGVGDLTWQWRIKESYIKGMVLDAERTSSASAAVSEKAQELAMALNRQGLDTILRQCPPEGVGDDLSGMTCYVPNGNVGHGWTTDSSGAMTPFSFTGGMSGMMGVASARNTGRVFQRTGVATTTSPTIDDGCPQHPRPSSAPANFNGRLSTVVSTRAMVQTAGAMIGGNLDLAQTLNAGSAAQAQRLVEKASADEAKRRAFLQSLRSM